MSIYSKEFKEEAIRLSYEIGNKKVAAQLGILYYTLADWQNRSNAYCVSYSQNNSQYSTIHTIFS